MSQTKKTRTVAADKIILDERCQTRPARETAAAVKDEEGEERIAS